MQTKHSATSPFLLLAILVFAAFHQAAAQGSSFSYQGRLTLGTNVASGNWDLQFKLHDAAVNGNQVGSTVSVAPVVVNSGLFTVTLDFGAAFDGNARWLEVAARTNGSAFVHTNLFPRIAILPTPYAVNAGNGVPVGSVMAYMGTNPPPGWLLCNGTNVSRTVYAALFAVIGTSSGPGDGATTFHLPDMRGMFLRGFNGARTGSWSDEAASSRIEPNSGGNSGNAIGSYQASRNGEHTHGDGNLTALVTVNTSGNVAVRNRTVASWNSNDTRSEGGALTTSTANINGAIVLGNTGANSGNATQAYPINVSVNYIIKY